MKQLTIRGFDDELERRLQEMAQQEGTSVNKTVLTLLRRSTGLEATAPPPGVVGRSLDSFMGTWSAEQEAELRAAVEVFKRVDEDFWS